MIKRTTYFAAGILACLVVSCSSIMSDNETVAIRRPLDDKAVRVPLKTPVAPGRAEAFFKLDTGGDQMTIRPKETGLVVVVRIGGDEYRQTIASCKDPGIGSALGGGTERHLEVAACDGEYWLISEPGVVSVLRVDRNPDGEEIARFELPENIRAVSARDK